MSARLAQSVERKTLNLVVVGSSPTVGELKDFSFIRGHDIFRSNSSGCLFSVWSFVVSFLF